MTQRNDPQSASRRALLRGLASATAAGMGARLGDTMAAAKPPGTRIRAALDRDIEGDIYWRGEEGYEDARGMAVWRANKPARYPAVVVRAQSDEDVARAVRFAHEQGLKVGVRSGGHGWSSAHLRDDAMLVDLSEMQDVDVDPAARVVHTRPGVWGSEVNRHLDAHGLITPTAHHVDVGIGGFVLCGGFGWNSRLWGNGSEHLLSADVVTADGRLIRVDEKQNADFLWAARGSGPGFFGAVTRMTLQAHPLPKVWKVSVHSYPLDVFEQVFAWARGLGEQVLPYVELVITTSAANASGDWAEQRLTVAALAITDTEEQADRGLEILESCPVRSRAVVRRDKTATNLTERYASGTNADPPGFRFACDNMYTDAPAEVLVPRLRGMFTGLPSPRSHVFWFNWGPPRKWPDMALSVQADIYLAAYSVWDDPTQDERMERWPVEQVGRLADLSAGGQMNDENMRARAQRYLSVEAEQRLETLRARHDPDGVFVSFLRA